MSVPPGPSPQDPSRGLPPQGPPPGPYGGPSYGQPLPPPPRRRSRGAVVAAVVGGVVVALLLAGGGGLGTLLWVAGDDEGDGPASQAPAAPEPTGDLPETDPALAAYYDQELDWEDCPGGECASLTVPLDYADPDGETIDVAVIRVPARDRDNRIGQLVLNPGGPGASGVDYARAGSLVTGSALARVYDLVGFDPRGVGQSAPVTCGPTAVLDERVASDPDPDTPEEEAEVDAQAREFGESCLAESGDVLRHVSTVEAARDMDVLRGALREPALDYLGTSYGTYLGATYAELFPDHVGRMVLDAAVTPDTDPVKVTREQLGGFQTALEAYLASCVESGDCPLGDDVDSAQQGMAQLLSDLDEQPISTQGERELTEGRAVYGIFLPLYAPSLWPQLTEALRAAQAGDGTRLGMLSDQYVSRGADAYTSNLFEALPAVNCLDVGPDAPTPDPADHVEEFEAISPVFGRIFAAGLTGCEQWPVKATQDPPTLRADGAPPIVVVGTTRDPATPYSWAVELSDALATGVLVSRDGDGHAGFNQGNECVDSAVIDFLIDDEVPDDGLRC